MFFIKLNGNTVIYQSFLLILHAIINEDMNIKKILPIVLVALILLAACGGGKNNGKNGGNVEVVKDVRLPGDFTVYGLACDGCTDSVLVLLPSDDSDPVTYNIISAMRSHKVFGRPRIGDQMAVVVNKDNKHVADIVIDLDELKGEWVYLAQPRLRKRGPLGGMKMKPSPESDSLMQTLMVPREQGFKLKKQYMMQPVGLQYAMSVGAGDSPVEYPQVKYYTEWNVLNGKLVFTEGTIEFGNRKRKKARPMRDTVDIVLMMKDSLQLRFKDGIKSYYRKK